jgi:excinuclease UvrABC nuclease subunit
VFFFRSFQNWGNRAYYPKADRSHESPEIMASFLAQFYDDKPIPDLVLLSHDVEERELLEEALSTHAGRKIEVAVPQRGEKKGLVEHDDAKRKEIFNHMEDLMEDSGGFIFVCFEPFLAIYRSNINPVILADGHPDPTQFTKA